MLKSYGNSGGISEFHEKKALFFGLVKHMFFVVAIRDPAGFRYLNWLTGVKKSEPQVFHT